jgi:hypothetical protein
LLLSSSKPSLGVFQLASHLLNIPTSTWHRSFCRRCRVFKEEAFTPSSPRHQTFINQAKYIQDMLKKFNMDSGVKGAKTPMPTKVTLDLDPSGKVVDQKLYRSMIGSLLYLCASRPDIMLSVGICARY